MPVPTKNDVSIDSCAVCKSSPSLSGYISVESDLRVSGTADASPSKKLPGAPVPKLGQARMQGLRTPLRGGGPTMTVTTAKGSHLEIFECGDSDVMSDDDQHTTHGGSRDLQPQEKIGNNELIEELAKVRMQLRKSQQVRMKFLSRRCSLTHRPLIM
jgi:hypothetical protein